MGLGASHKNGASGYDVKGHMIVHGNVYNYQNIYTGPSVPHKKITGFVNVDSPTPNFTGRAALLKTIHERLVEASKKTDYADRIVILHGLGGIGKSEVARKYAHTHLESPVIKNIAWIDAENKNSLKASFVALAKRLGLPADNPFEEVEQLVENIYEYFSANVGTGLFIFDNALQMNSADKNFGILNYLPIKILRRRPLVLITTRKSDWDGISRENKITVDELSNEEAVEFLVKAFQLTNEQQTDKEEMEAVQSLAHNLQGFPLGLTLATSNIRNTMWSAIKDKIHSYMERMNVPKGDWLDDGLSKGVATKYDLIMNNVWTATFDKIESLEDQEGITSLKLLNIMAYLPPDGITPERVIAIFKFIFKENCENDCFFVLEKYSVIAINKSTEAQLSTPHRIRVRIHRLVQRCTREKFDRESRSFYLFGISNYLIHNPNTIDDIQYWTAIHNHLSERQWPHKSIHYSILFSAQVLELEEYYFYLETVWTFVQDIQGYLKEIKPLISENIDILFKLCYFYFQTHKNQPFCHMEELREPLLVETLENNFVAAVKEFLLHLLSSSNESSVCPEEEDLLYIVQQQTNHMCNEILSCPSYGLRKELLENLNISEFLISRVSSNNIKGRLETCDQIYLLLWKLVVDSVMPASVPSCVKTVVGIHKQVFSKSVTASAEQIKQYWESGGPFYYGYISVMAS